MIKENIKNWLKVNLFSNWYNSIISLFVLFFILSIIPSFIDWQLSKLLLLEKQKLIVKQEGLAGFLLAFGLKNLFMDFIQTNNFGELI